MNRLRNRLIVIFLAATLVPLGVTVWITTTLLDRSLRYASTVEIDQLSHTLQRTGRELYQRACSDLKTQAADGKLTPSRYGVTAPQVRDFAASGEAERFRLAGRDGEQLQYLVRRGPEVLLYSTTLGDTGLEQVSRQYRRARELVLARTRADLHRGFTYTFVLLAACVWLAALALLIYLAHRVSRPIQQLTAGLTRLAGGDLSTRVDARRDDEIGRAIQAFNYMAGRLQSSTERLVYLTQLASWQSLARKMAHEVKNSLTPIRLTVEEMVARQERRDSFLETARQIVVEEIESLERRVRAFSQFAAEPPVNPEPLDINTVLEERIAFLRTAHPEVEYQLRLAGERPNALADPDLVKGILTNLLENAAEAAGEGGRILGITAADDGKVLVEVHDSGPGLNEQVRQSLFQPTISFKKRGMGLGLSIARKSALLSGGDILLVKGELGGAAFRVVLPVVTHGVPACPDRG